MTQLPGLVRMCEELSEEELLIAIGSALDGSGLNVSPVDPERLRRFARRWFDAKAAGLWQQVQRSQTYQIWAATAGPEQVIEAGDLAEALVQDGVPGGIAAPVAVAMQRNKIASADDYDVAVSCAERQCDYAGRVVAAARALGLRVFFEPEMTYEWWGKNFLAEGRRIYGSRAWHFVPFLSAEYLVEPRLQDAFQSAMFAAVARGDDYILPVLSDDVRIPPELLPPHIGYMRADAHSPTEIAAALAEKVVASKARAEGALDIGVMVQTAVSDQVRRGRPH